MTDPAADLDVQPLTGANWDALAGLFGEGGDPKRCWCWWFRQRGSGISWQTAEHNRERLRGLADRPDLAPGLVALRDGRAVGWVSLGPRSDYERLTHSRVLAPVDDRPVWSIVCFVVSRSARGQGVANALLDAAVDYAREHGATLLEAYPLDTSEGRVSSASAYTGTLAMFERAGFSVAAVRQATRTSRPRPVVRRPLTP